MATRRAKKERVARTQVRRTVEERNLEKNIFNIYSTEKGSVIDNNNNCCRSQCKSHLENLRIMKCERFWRTSDHVRRELQKAQGGNYSSGKV